MVREKYFTMLKHAEMDGVWVVVHYKVGLVRVQVFIQGGGGL